MRKFLFIATLVALMTGLTGCKDRTVNLEKAETFDLTVLQRDWQFDKDMQQFYYHFNVPEITSKVYNYGNWTLSREFYKGYSDAYQVALPMTYFLTDTLTDKSVVYYTQHIDYRLGVGYVEVQLTNSDYIYPTYPDGTLAQPDDMYFRLQLIY